MPAALPGPVVAMHCLVERLLLLARQPMPEHLVGGQPDGGRRKDALGMSFQSALADEVQRKIE